MNVTAVPNVLRELRQWVCWRTEQRNGKPTKVPYCPHQIAMMAAVDRPRTWSSFEVAVARAGYFDGIGFVFTKDDPYCGVDLDELNDEARSIVDLLDSYTERSVSGRGVHVLVQARLDTAARKRKGWLEVYDRDRYFVVTGWHLEDTPLLVEPRQAELEEVLAEFLQPIPAPRAARAPARPVSLDDRELLERAFAARNGADVRDLYLGRWEHRYRSQSEADAALCRHLAYWCGRDPARVDRLFRTSGLYREKWERQNYRERTLALALGHSYGGNT